MFFAMQTSLSTSMFSKYFFCDIFQIKESLGNIQENIFFP